MLKDNEVYLIQFDYSCDDCQGTNIYLHKTRKGALAKLKKLIKQEIKFYQTEYNHIEPDRFELDTNINEKYSKVYYWNYECKDNWYLHTHLYLSIYEVKE